VYKAANPRTLKGKNKHLLPVYWMHNKKAWITKVLFLQWFYNCFLVEVKKYLDDKGLPFKVLLILDNAPGHPEPEEYSAKGVEVVFLSANTTSLIQPLDQGVIWAFKVHYTRQSMIRIVDAMDISDEMEVCDFWKQFNVALCLTLIEEALVDVKSESVNACWRTLWPDCVNEFTGFTLQDQYTEVLKEIVDVVKKVGGKGFDDLQVLEVEELLEDHGNELTQDDLDDLVKSADKEEKDDDGHSTE